MPFALLGAAAIGISLGLLGSGGSILTVPVLVYLLGQPDKVAIAGSLFIVGGISLAAAVPYLLRKQVDWRSVLLFGLPGMLGSWAGAYLANFVSGSFQLLLFAAVMIIAAAFMLRPPRGRSGQATAGLPWWLLGLEGLLVGVVTGLVGVGGGFLIVPALALLGGLPLRRAIGTSLLIISLKSAVGFAEYLQVLAAVELQLDWNVITLFTVIGAAFSLFGRRLGRNLPTQQLQRWFGVFLLLVGGFVLWQNLPVRENSGFGQLRSQVSQGVLLVRQQEQVLALQTGDRQQQLRLSDLHQPQRGVSVSRLDEAAHAHPDAKTGMDGAAHPGRSAHFQLPARLHPGALEHLLHLLEHQRS